LCNFFSDEEYPAVEALILAPGLDGWEARAIGILKQTTKESFESLGTQVSGIQRKYKRGVPHPDQVDWEPSTKDAPHLRVYFCLKCGHKITSLALSGICCYGAPECSRCHHVLHEPTCKNFKAKEPK
jgi:hypothetical protein